MDWLDGLMLAVGQLPNTRPKDKVPLRKFSTFIKKMIVELDRDPALYPDENIIEVRSPSPSSLTLLSGVVDLVASNGWTSSCVGRFHYSKKGRHTHKNSGFVVSQSFPGTV
jgi:hypothetical protein